MRRFTDSRPLHVTRHLTRHAWSLLLGALVACHDTTDPVSRNGTFTLVAPSTVRVTDVLADVPDTLVFEARDSFGRLLPYFSASRGATTGWLRTVTERDWSRRGNVIADSTGRLRLLWQTSDAPMQTLELLKYVGDDSLARVRFDFTLQRPAAALRADTVVSSGRDAVCFLSSARVGCVGHGRCISCGTVVTTDRAIRSPHWLQFTAAPLSLSSTVVGACALLSDGNTACWDGLGPDSVARNDVAHPPLVEMRGSIGRTASGQVWKGVFGSETGSTYAFQNRTWLRIPSDSVITDLLDDGNSLIVCALTNSRAVMCSPGTRVTPVLPDPPFRVGSMQLLRVNRDSSLVRALGGYTDAVYVTRDFIVDRVALRLPDGSNVSYSPLKFRDTGAFADASADVTLRSADPRERACVPNLDSLCLGGPWHSVSESGRSALIHNGVIETGFRRTCGVRDVVVCWSYVGGGERQRATTITIDTIRIAP